MPAIDLECLGRTRRQLGLTLNDIAHLIGVHQSTLCHWHTGAALPPPIVRARLETYVELVEMLRRMFDGPDLAARWLHDAKLTSLGGRTTPLQAMPEVTSTACCCSSRRWRREARRLSLQQEPIPVCEGRPASQEGTSRYRADVATRRTSAPRRRIVRGFTRQQRAGRNAPRHRARSRGHAGWPTPSGRGCLCRDASQVSSS